VDWHFKGLASIADPFSFWQPVHMPCGFKYKV
jgi:hypothetical protein